MQISPGFPTTATNDVPTENAAGAGNDTSSFADEFEKYRLGADRTVAASVAATQLDADLSSAPPDTIKMEAKDLWNKASDAGFNQIADAAKNIYNSEFDSTFKAPDSKEALDKAMNADLGQSPT